MPMETYKFPDEMDKVQTEEDAESIDFEVEGDDLDIEVVEDTPEGDRGRKPLSYEAEEPTEDELAGYSKKVQDRIKELTRARHDERRVKEATIREKTEQESLIQRLLEENNSLKKYVNTGEQAMAQTLKQSAEAELESAKRKYREAHEAFDTDAIIEAQDALTDARIKLERMKSFRPNALHVEDNPVYIPPTQTAEPQLDERTTRWMAKNPWFGDRATAIHKEMTTLAMNAHDDLVTNGVDPRTDEYFERIDARMRKRFPDFFGETKAKKPASVVASGVRTASGTKKVKLTQTQVDLANKWKIPLEEMARQVALQQEKANG